MTTPETYSHPGYVYLAQMLGINILSEDANKIARFAEAVAGRATLAEREACATLCDDMVLYTGFDCAAAIRARGQGGAA
jgi:hypothetical protein